MRVEADEKGIIACCLLGGIDLAIELVESVPASAFTTKSTSQAFAVLEEMAVGGLSVDSLSFVRAYASKFSGGYPGEVLAAQDNVGSQVSEFHVFKKSVLDALRRRRLKESAQRILAAADNVSIPAEKTIADAEAALLGEDIDAVRVVGSKEGLLAFTNDLERRYNLRGSKSGVVTGFYKLDDLLDGIQFSEQTIIAARPSMGKTAIALNIVHRACIMDKVPTLFVSLEMSINALLRRLVSSVASMPMHLLKSGAPGGDDRQAVKVTQANAAIHGSPIWFVDGVAGMDINRLAAIVRRCVRKHGIELVVIDYLQKIRPAARHEKRTYEVAEVSGALKALAVSTNVALLTLAQLNRDSEKDKTPRKPRLADLADSGQIERDADTVALLHRERENPDEPCQLIVAKQRDGELGLVPLRFNGQFCRFENLTNVAEEE